MEKRPSTTETEQSESMDEVAEQVANEQPSKESVSADSAGDQASAQSDESPIEQIPEETTSLGSPKKRAKNPAAVSLGRLGGLKGGKARARTLTKSERSEAARKAALARWRKKKQTK